MYLKKCGQNLGYLKKIGKNTNQITYHETDQKSWFLLTEGCFVLCSADEVTWRNVVKIEVTLTK